MLRAALATMLILLAGCATRPPADVDALPAEAMADDGMLVTATRVEPLLHVVDVSGRIALRPCNAPTAAQCPGGAVNVGGRPVGVDWARPRHDFADPAALFWRAGLVLEWDTQGLAGLSLRLSATTPCGVACVEERPVAVLQSSDAGLQAPLGPAAPGAPRSLRIEPQDIFLEPGETGLRVAIEPDGLAETSVAGAGIEYRLRGAVAGYRAAGEPFVLGHA